MARSRSRRSSSRSRSRSSSRRARSGCRRVRVSFSSHGRRVSFMAHRGPNCPKRRKPRVQSGMRIWAKAAKACARKRGTGRVGSRAYTACMRTYVRAHGGRVRRRSSSRRSRSRR